MTTVASITLTVVLTMFFALQGRAQGPLAPLFLSISGSGEIHRRIRANRRGLPTSSVSGGRLRSLPWVLDRKKAENLC
jgi:hypothetical protein